MARWRPVDATFPFRPEEFVRVEQALTVLQFMCQPTFGAGADSGRVSGSAGSGGGDSLDPSTVRYRRLLGRMLRRLDAMSREIVATATGTELGAAARWRCPKCNRFQRSEAVACDRCVPQVLRPDLEGVAS